MRHWAKQLTALALALAMLLAVTGCASKEEKQVRDTITRFESACQQADLEGILACLDPNQASMVENSVNLLGALGGVDGMEALSSVVSLLFGVADPDGAFLSTIRIDVKSVAVEDNWAKAACEFSCDVSGTHYSSQFEFSLRHVNDEEAPWRIAGFEPISN
ncbi:MAG: hypothetical protein IJ751_03920 [Oscillospiraceae bacterium]|nr:hypothetical protein [Oscillospiraceae bacterium]